MAGSIVVGVALWIVGVHVFDGVHWGLHRMMRSHRPWLRWLATPHVMHHRWLDRSLTTRWEYQRANVWGHLVLEYGTQLGFSMLLLPVAPPAAVGVCVGIQTLAFGYLLSQRGLDVNHRAIDVLDAYRPSLIVFPAYHALHHVWPDAHFSAYSKLVDYLVAGGTHLPGKRVVLVGDATPLGRALIRRLRREGVGEVLPMRHPGADVLRATDVLVICDPRADRVALVEAYVRATCARQLPPEVWAVQTRIDDARARHYYGDVRVTYRALAVAEARHDEAAAAERAAEIVLGRVRRGFNFVPTTRGLAACRDFLRFRRTVPRRPASHTPVRRRADLLAA